MVRRGSARAGFRLCLPAIIRTARLRSIASRCSPDKKYPARGLLAGIFGWLPKIGIGRSLALAEKGNLYFHLLPWCAAQGGLQFGFVLVRERCLQNPAACAGQLV